MADRLYLSIWFPSFQEQEMLPRLLSVLKQFPFSAGRPGIGYLAIRSISWDQRRFTTSNISVPEASATSMARSPVSLKRT